MSGNVHAPLKGQARLDQEAIEEFTHTNEQDFSKAGSAATDDAPPMAPKEQSQYDKDYEQFILKAGAIASRRGSYQEIADELAKYPALRSQASELMTDVRTQHPDLPEDQAAVEAEVQQNHQNIASAMGVGGEKKDKDESSLAGAVTDLVAIAAAASLFKGALEKFKDGAEAMGLSPDVAQIANAEGANIMNSGLQDVADLGTGFSPKDARVSHGMPGKQRSQEAGITA